MEKLKQKIKNLLSSVKIKLFITLSLTILLIIIFLIIVNNFALENYYLYSKEKTLNKKILQNQVQSKIINLNNTLYLLKYHKGILKIEIYDTNIKEETEELQITEKVELQVKLNKKIKLWE